MFKKIFVMGVLIIMSLGLFAGCGDSGIWFKVDYGAEGGFGKRIGVSKLVQSLEEMRDLCEEYSNDAYNESSEYYSVEEYQRIRSYDEVFFEEKALIVYSTFLGGDITKWIRVNNITVEETQLVVTLHHKDKGRGTWHDNSRTWLFLIEVNKADVLNVINVQVNTKNI